MAQSAPDRRSSSPFEYFLYAAIFAETALAALIYKAVFHSADLVQMRIYFAIFYFAFLAWAIWQLHKLHRNRMLATPNTTAPGEPSPMAEPAQQDAAVEQDAGRVLGLTTAQLVIIVVVFATAVATFSYALRLLG